MICRLKERSLFFFHLLPFFTELDLPGLKRTHVKPLSSPLPSIAAGLVVAGCAATAPVLSSATSAACTPGRGEKLPWEPTDALHTEPLAVRCPSSPLCGYWLCLYMAWCTQRSSLPSTAALKRSKGVPVVTTGVFPCHNTKGTYGLCKCRAFSSGTVTHSHQSWKS